MKKIVPYLLLGLIISAIILSCKKDKNEVPQVGIEKWYINKIISEEFNPPGVIVYSKTETAWTPDDYLTLQTDGKFTLARSGSRLDGTYKIENSSLIFTYLEKPNQYNTINASIVEKSLSSLIFFADDPNGSSIYRTTIYFKK